MAAMRSHTRRPRSSKKQARRYTFTEGPSRTLRDVEVYALSVGTTLTPSGTWQIQNGLTAIPSSAGQVDRQGLRVTPHSMQFMVTLHGNPAGQLSSASPDHFMRFVIFQSRYASPIAADLFDSTSSIHSFFNISHVGQGRADANIAVLHDEWVPVHVLANSASHRNIEIPASAMMVKQFRFADFTTIDPLNGGIYFAFITENTVAAKYGTITLASRLNYTDA
jgi:hypothetical protein